MVAGGVVGTECVDDHQVQIGANEREVVVAAVPDQHIRLRAGSSDDLRVVHAGKNHVASRQMRLVFLSLLDRAARGGEVRGGREALDSLLLEVAIGHRVADDRDAPATRAHAGGEPPRNGGLSTARADRGDRHDRHRRGEHRVLRPEQREVGAHGQRPGRQRHDVGVRNVAIREDDERHALAAADRLEVRFVLDRDAVRVSGAG